MGIGRATAVCLAELGADLVLADRAPLDAVRADVEAAGRSALVLQGDLTDEKFLQRIVASGPFFFRSPGCWRLQGPRKRFGAGSVRFRHARQCTRPADTGKRSD